MSKITLSIDLPGFEAVVVKLLRDAHGGLCLDCGMAWNEYTERYWHWKKSKAMHERGRHRCVYYAIRPRTLNSEAT